MSFESIKPSSQQIAAQVTQALAEDLGGEALLANDITANLIAPSVLATATVITREDMVVCGREWATAAFTLLDDSIEVDWFVKDGDVVSAGAQLFTLKGNARAILCGERTALNFLQTLSATATVTHSYAAVLAAIPNSKTKLLDTRKTLPLLRQAQKYAVLCGGGNNHRIGLFDAYLIKENHIATCGGITQAVAQARAIHPSKPVEVEVESKSELDEAVAAGADVIMLDNFTTEQVKQAVDYVAGRCKLEVSGNITQERLTELAQTNVDFISSGALTKHVQAIDLSMRLNLLSPE